MYTTFFLHISFTIFSYLALAISFFGIGWLTTRIFFRPAAEPHFFLFTWIGWAVSLLLIQIVNIFYPINIFASIPVLLTGLLSSFFFFIKEARIKKPLPPSTRIFLVILAGTALWVAHVSLHAPTNNDSGIYHFNSIRWLNESPIVLGLGNLHGRLAFNQSLFAYVAYLNLFPLFNHGHNIANSFLWLLLFAECLWGVIKFIFIKVDGDLYSLPKITPVYFLPVILYIALYSRISSPTPDNTSSILQILIFINFVRILDTYPVIRIDNVLVFYLLILSATSVTIKLSNLFYVLSLSFILLYFWLKSIGRFNFHPPKLLVQISLLPMLILSIWGLRGYLFSGCPVYPSTFGCINVHWSVPIEAVKSEADWVYSWARWPYQPPEKVLNSWEWFKPWFNAEVMGNVPGLIYPLIVFASGMIACIILMIQKPSTRNIFLKWIILIVPVLVGISFWFFLAPGMRFAHSIFWILPVASTLIFLAMYESFKKISWRIILITFIIVNGCISWILLSDITRFLNISPGGYMPIPSEPLIEQTTFSGLKVLTPIESDRCWDSNLPCTPYYNAALTFNDEIIFPEFFIKSPKNPLSP